MTRITSFFPHNNPISFSPGYLHPQGPDRGRHPLPGHEVRQPHAAEDHPDPDGAGQRDRQVDPAVHHDRPAAEGNAAAGRRRRKQQAAAAGGRGGCFLIAYRSYHYAITHSGSRS